MQKKIKIFDGWFIVAAFTIGISSRISPFVFASLGLFINTIPWMILAAILVGLSLGAEIDILAYMIGKYFGLSVKN